MKSLLKKYIFLLLVLSGAGNLSAQRPRTVPDSISQKWKKEKEFEYANNPVYWQKDKTPDQSALIKFISFLSAIIAIRWLLYILGAAVLGYILYQVVVVNNFFIFTKPALRKKNNAAAVPHPDRENYDEYINAAVHAKEYRLAIRYSYLKTIKLLSDRHMLMLHAKATNHEYVLQMQAQSGGKEFRLLTAIYEYVWYGGFQPDPERFEIISDNFKQFNNQI